MSSRKAFHGPHRKLVLALDVGTTYSGVSYSILDPGQVPQIQGVNRYPGQEGVGGNSKIPSVIFYDPAGRVRAVGAEALQESVLETAEDEQWVKVEWFKLHLRPKGMQSLSITDFDIPPLPESKTAVSVFADFLQYLFKCTCSYIQDTESREFWGSVENHIEYILSLPNGWEGPQQQGMRHAAVMAGLIRDTAEDHARLQFVTEAEASLHFCIQNGLAIDAATATKGIIIVDAGGGTVDVSTYSRASSSGSDFEEITSPQCHLQGSVFVSRRARAYIENKLQGSLYGNAEDVDHITSCFDKSTKLSFRNSEEPCFIKFGTARDKDPRFDIRSGQMKLPGKEVATLFQPSVELIINVIKQQCQEASIPISAVFLVGGFAANDWLFAKIEEYLKPLTITLRRPDRFVNKAVADGAVSFYLDHFVSVRIARFTYGTDCSVRFDPRNPEHKTRSSTIYTRTSGVKTLPKGFSTILAKGTRVSEDKEFTKQFFRENTIQSGIEVDIICYKGNSGSPRWMDVEPNMFSTLCTVVVDASQLATAFMVQHGPSSTKIYILNFSVVLLFGLTELKAYVTWMENGTQKRTPAKIVYDSDIAPLRRLDLPRPEKS